MKRISAFFLSLVLCFGMVVSGLDIGTRAEAKDETYTVTIDTSNRSFAWPVPSSDKISSCFGTDYTSQTTSRNHQGIDISAPSGTAIVASAGGVVETVKYSTTCGYYVVLKHTINGKTYRTRYLHMQKKSTLAIGATVTQGQTIGYVGSTGRSTGPHLHFEIYNSAQKFDPGANTILPKSVHCVGTYSCCNTYVEKITTTYTDTIAEWLRSTVTGRTKSRVRAAEEARQLIGKQYDNNGSFTNKVLAAAGAKSFSTSNNAAAITQQYVINAAFHSARNTFKTEDEFRSVTAAQLNGLYQSGYTPRVGDVVMYDTNGDTKGPERSGIVVGVSGTGIKAKVTVIWQKTGATKAVLETVPFSSKIWGYCSPFYKVDDLGDFDRNGVVNINDANAFKNNGYKVNASYETLWMDVNSDGKVDSKDYDLMKRQIAAVQSFNGSALRHKVGRNTGSACEANTGKDKEGYLAYGPYTKKLSTGWKTASFNLKIDNNSANNNQVAVVEVYDATKKTLLASRPVFRKEFIAKNVYQSIQLHFYNTTAGDELEYRVYYCGNSALTLQKVVIRNNLNKYQAEEKVVSHKVGYKVSDGWKATVSHAKGYMLYGPYEDGVPVGARKATFRMKIDNNTADKYEVAILSVYDATTKQVLASKSVKRNEFTYVNTYRDFTLPFHCPSSTDKLEYRVYYCGNSALTVDYVNLT